MNKTRFTRIKLTTEYIYALDTQGNVFRLRLSDMEETASGKAQWVQLPEHPRNLDFHGDSSRGFPGKKPRQTKFSDSKSG